MATYSTAAITTPAISTSGIQKREVTEGDKWRHLFPGSPILALVAKGAANKTGAMNFQSKAGMISKRQVTNPKYEVFTYSPLAVEFTVATFSSVASYTVSSADGLTEKMCLVNTANNTVCRISSITSTTLVCVTVGSTTFTAAASDKLLALAPAYGENSSSPYILSKTEDNVYNYLFIPRFPVAISKSAEGNDTYAGGPGAYWKLVKARNVVEGLRKVENSLIWSQYASSGDTTSDSTLSDAFRTTKGMYQWTGASYPCGGSLDYAKFSNDMVLGMNESARRAGRVMVLLESQKSKGLQNLWGQDKLNINESGEKDEFGVLIAKVMTSGPTIKLQVHDSFDRGTNTTKGLIFDPEDYEYVFKKGRDIQARNGIQLPSTDGFEDEIFGEIGINPIDGGNATTTLTAMF